MRARILLIQPDWQGLGYRRKIKMDERVVRPLAAATVAALCGDREVRVLDAAVEPLPSDWSAWDLVGVTAYTFNGSRAFDIADKARAAGKAVVLGGPHVSMARELCLNHADAVVEGDAEGAFENLLADFEAGALKKIYRNPGCAALVSPRRDLMLKTNAGAAWMEVSRGCANSCSFCYLHALPTKSMRLKPVSAIVAELKAIPQEVVLFVDDNLFCAREYALEVFRAIAPLKKKWWIQAPANIVDDFELLDAAAAAGCFSMTIGFQTVSGETLARERIEQNKLESYKRLVDQLQARGILVDGTFIFGFDTDTKDTFTATAAMIKRLGINAYTIYFLTPYPGAPQYDEWVKTGRLPALPNDDYDWEHPVLEPASMTRKELEEGICALFKDLDRGYFWYNGLRTMLKMPYRNLTPASLKVIFGSALRYQFSPRLIGRSAA
jgi:radical SAM superfamily enzyme YgiQ (UPF0313 family)